jgi:outer membrane protein
MKIRITRNLLKKITNWKFVMFALLTVLLTVNILFFILNYNRSHPKIGYVDTAFLFSKFKMTHEMELRLKQMNESQEGQLKIQLNNINNTNSKIDSVAVSQKYQVEAQKIQNSNKEIAVQYNEQIWKQLNQYVKEYGEMNHFTVLLGANGAGSVMAADSTLDQTNMILAYANKRYEGQNAINHESN